MSLTAEQIRNIQDVKVKEVEVEEWGDTVFVRTFSAADRERVESVLHKAADDGTYQNVRPLICSLTLCDSGGTRLYGDEGIAQLSDRNAKALDRISDAALAINKMDSVALEETEKN